MKYLGSKNRIFKFILPIMLKEAKENDINTWIEPFVGGGNMIDKVPLSFKRVGGDINPHAIQALIAVRDLGDDLPPDLDEDDYNRMKGGAPSPISSLFRFGSSFGGKFEGGFARSKNKNGEPRNHWKEAIKNAQKQKRGLRGVELVIENYDYFSDVKNSLIYCDPPYEGTTPYKTGGFNHDKFWNWCRKMSKNNKVFISEYQAPEDFVCVWAGEVKTNFASKRTGPTHSAIEKLFRAK